MGNVYRQYLQLGTLVPFRLYITQGGREVFLFVTIIMKTMIKECLLYHRLYRDYHTCFSKTKIKQ